MPNSKYTLSIPKPCQENWEEMTVTEQGKFCSNCQKQVVDFSSMSETEIVRKIKASSGAVCGRLRKSSVDREIVIEEKSLWKYFQKIAAGILLLNFFGNKSMAGNALKEEPVPVYFSDEGKGIETRIEIPADSLITMNFTVLDSKTKKPVAFTQISIHSDSILIKQATTDRNGKIQIYIPTRFLKATLEVQVSNFPQAYVSQSLRIVPEKTIYSRKIVLVQEELIREQIMGDIELKE
jgi:hypothetical protein